MKVWNHGHHRLLLTPEGGFFVVLLRPILEVVGHDVSLLFSFKDLYLCGLLHEVGFGYVLEIRDAPNTHSAKSYDTSTHSRVGRIL